MTAQEHNRALGIAHLAYGGFHLLITMLFLFFLFVISVPRDGGNFDAGFFSIFMLVMLAFGLLFTLPSLLAGYALLKRKSWARTASIVAGILATPSFPYGTALGVYTLWFMFGNEGKAFYERQPGVWTPDRVGALPDAHDTLAGPRNEREREREHTPPPQMPNWR
jgi:hypothetical protein